MEFSWSHNTMFPVGAKLMKWKNGGFWDSHPNKPSLDNDFITCTTCWNIFSCSCLSHQHPINAHAIHSNWSSSGNTWDQRFQYPCMLLSTLWLFSIRKQLNASQHVCERKLPFNTSKLILSSQQWSVLFLTYRTKNQISRAPRPFHQIWGEKARENNLHIHQTMDCKPRVKSNRQR